MEILPLIGLALLFGLAFVAHRGIHRYFRWLETYRVYVIKDSPKTRWSARMSAKGGPPDSETKSLDVALSFLDTMLQSKPQGTVRGRLYKGHMLLYVTLPNAIAACPLDEM